jgi:type VI secretion system protein ImpG
MNREFLDLYNQELSLLHEQAREYAEEYPGIAERLGGLVAERMDPAMAGLLEGAAFLAARVQLKLKHEFPEFTNSLFEQLVPNYLAPTPSFLLARVEPPYADPALRDGHVVPRDSYLDATYRERERRIACRYRTTAPVTLWPFAVAGADYIASPGGVQALGIPVGSDTVAGLRLALVHRKAAAPEDEPADSEAAKDPSIWFAGCRMKDLTIHLAGPDMDAIALYEQIFANRVGVYLRYADAFGNPVIAPLGPDHVTQIGFEDDEALLPLDKRVSRGFDYIREYFAFSRKYLGFRIGGFAKHLPAVKSRNLEIVITFDRLNPRLPAAVRPDMFALYAVPAVNLFEKTTDRIPVKVNRHEYHVVPDRSRVLDFEPHRILDVHAHIPGAKEKVRVYPLYSPAKDNDPDARLFYTVRRMPRRRTAEERRYGGASDYTGTDVFLSLTEPTAIGEEGSVAELSVRALCSNRHLPEQLPVGRGGADFRFLDDVSLGVTCIMGPTPPREPVVGQMRRSGETAHAGSVAWRLINMLSLNQLGLVQRGAGRSGESLREILSLFAESGDSVVDRRIRGVRAVDSRPVVRRIRQRAGVGVARGLEVTITIDEKAFEGSGIFLLGAVLDRFFADYVALNTFTQTVIRSVERGEIMRWPPRTGSRRPL